MRPCHPVDHVESCPLCRLFATNAAYRARRGGRPIAPPAKKPALPKCPHRGEATGETVTCPTCSGRVELKLFACAVHGRCTTKKKADGVACCVGCLDRPS